MSQRPTNAEACAAFRQLMTEGCPAELREATRPWRGELWRAFAELQDRLCPSPPEREAGDEVGPPP